MSKMIPFRREYDWKIDDVLDQGHRVQNPSLVFFSLWVRVVDAWSLKAKGWDAEGFTRWFTKCVSLRKMTRQF